MINILFDAYAIIHIEFIPRGTTVIRHCYWEVLKCFMAWVHSALSTNCYAFSCSCLTMHQHHFDFVQEFLAFKNVVMLYQPPHSPDSSSCEYFLFLKLKSHLKEPFLIVFQTLKWLWLIIWCVLWRQISRSALMTITFIVKSGLSDYFNKHISKFSFEFLIFCL